ncbi:hypothetical protein RSK20926_02152 [Roseobacter sp. SK209-2-6]|uniref:DUF3883 domain-containing protein n=1 Tax=Roseobacter sp. SK209-2-6 TaxID=388739 RepID=UPI0000F3E411|nr:DUF3883 domain-containing protein [Roseobacter sp. SK209-2-6]EBA14433.1 hypothetical protein RSK20926_02152 [Roseobacter sp. SK209-2-6]
MSGEEWSDLENDAIVADYFSMLSDELGGNRYNKAAHNRALQELIGRSKGSIEFKHQNISAVLKGLGETWINGYKPAFNFQMSLVDAVARHLQQRGEWIARKPTAATGLSEAPGTIWISTPPTMQNTPPPDELEQMQAVARRFDVAGRDERNRSLGKAGEERVLHHERAILNSAGRQDLAKKVRWVSQEDGDGAGYDISSFTPEGSARLIEVKTTNGWERTPFHVSRNELAVAENNRDSWTLFRLWNFSREPRAFELSPPLDAHVELTATSFQASFH